jgi:uncharacterized protein (TIGR00725 family)
VQIGIAAHSGDFSDDLVKKARAFLGELARECGEVHLVLGGYWGLMRIIVDEALRLSLSVVLVLPMEREDVELPRGVVRIRSGCDYRCRSIILVRSSDALVALGGGVGTMIEVFAAYAMGKPTYVLINTGMWSDLLPRAFPEYIDERRNVRIRYLEDPRELALLLCREGQGAGASVGG